MNVLPEMLLMSLMPFLKFSQKCNCFIKCGKKRK